MVSCPPSHGQGSKKAFSVELYGGATKTGHCNPDIVPSFMIMTERNWKMCALVAPVPTRSAFVADFEACGMHASGGNATRSETFNGTEMASTHVCSSYPTWHGTSLRRLTMNAGPRSDGQKAERAALAHCILHSPPTLSSSHTHDGF